MNEPVKLPDVVTHAMGHPMLRTERVLISRWAPIGPKGKLVELRYVVSRTPSQS